MLKSSSMSLSEPFEVGSNEVRQRNLPKFPNNRELVFDDENEELLKSLLPTLEKYGCLQFRVNKTHRSPWVRAFCDLYHPAGPWGSNKFRNTPDITSKRKYSFKGYQIPTLFRQLQFRREPLEVHKQLKQALEEYYQKETWYKMYVEGSQQAAAAEVNKPEPERALIPGVENGIAKNVARLVIVDLSNVDEGVESEVMEESKNKEADNMVVETHEEEKEKATSEHEGLEQETETENDQKSDERRSNIAAQVVENNHAHELDESEEEKSLAKVKTKDEEVAMEVDTHAHETEDEPNEEGRKKAPVKPNEESEKEKGHEESDEAQDLKEAEKDTQDEASHREPPRSRTRAQKRLASQEDRCYGANDGAESEPPRKRLARILPETVTPRKKPASPSLTVVTPSVSSSPCTNAEVSTEETVASYKGDETKKRLEDKRAELNILLCRRQQNHGLVNDSIIQKIQAEIDKIDEELLRMILDY